MNLPICVKMEWQKEKIENLNEDAKMRISILIFI